MGGFGGDLYKRLIKPSASDRQVLMVARVASVVGGGLAVGVAFVSKTIVDALSVFYTMIAVSLFVPTLAGLYLRRPKPLDALAAIAGGVVSVAIIQVFHDGQSIGVLTPSMCGLAAAAVACTAVMLVRRSAAATMQ